MSTNTATLNNFHPCAPKRKLENYADIINCKRPHAKKPMSKLVPLNSHLMPR